MTPGGLQARRRWALAALGALGAATLLLVLFRVPAVQPLARPAAAPVRPVQLAPTAENPRLNDATLLHDLAPLFLPTEWNAARSPTARREPGHTFLDDEPLKLSFGESELGIERQLPAVVTLEGKPLSKAEPADALADNSPTTMMLGFGRGESTVPALPARGGVVEVVAARSGERALPAQTLAVEAAPPTTKAWGPLEFVAAVDAAGLVAPLVLSHRSGVEEVDQYFKNYLAQTYRIGERLPPGFYRITVGP